MAEELSPQEAAARLRPRDSIGLPLGSGQPPAFMRALGERDDWEELRVAGALLAVGTNLFSHPGVHYLSGFFGPWFGWQELTGSGASATDTYQFIGPAT